MSSFGREEQDTVDTVWVWATLGMGKGEREATGYVQCLG
jgi:hypothetical protein